MRKKKQQKQKFMQIKTHDMGGEWIKQSDIKNIKKIMN